MSSQCKICGLRENLWVRLAGFSLCIFSGLDKNNNKKNQYFHDSASTLLLPKKPAVYSVSVSLLTIGDFIHRLWSCDAVWMQKPNFTRNDSGAFILNIKYCYMFPVVCCCVAAAVIADPHRPRALIDTIFRQWQITMLEWAPPPLWSDWKTRQGWFWSSYYFSSLVYKCERVRNVNYA